jgi:hypothetical protein
MGCKNCKQKVLHIRTGKQSPVKYSGKTAYFVTKGGYKEIPVEANGKRYVFYENDPIQAPIEFQSFVFLQIVNAPAEKKTTDAIKENPTTVSTDKDALTVDKKKSK